MGRQGPDLDVLLVHRRGDHRHHGAQDHPWPSLRYSGSAPARERSSTAGAYGRGPPSKWTRRFAFIITFFFSLSTSSTGGAETRSTRSVDGTATAWWVRFSHLFSAGNLPLLFQVFFLFIANMLLFMGPLLAMGIMQIKAFEPGDAEWGVKLEDVRGQAEAKEEIRRIVTLWQSGEVFEKSGGKRERGLLFLGAPGTGKTMMAKAIATGFNSPFVTSRLRFTGVPRHRRRDRPRHGGTRKAARPQVGRQLHRLHRRDRRRRHAPLGARSWRRRRDDGPGDDESARRLQPDVLRAARRAQPERRRDRRKRRLARLHVRSSGGGVARCVPGLVREGREPRQPGNLPRHGRRRPARAQPAARGDGRRRQPAVPEALPHEPGQHVPRRDLHPPPPARQGSRSRVLRRRGPGRRLLPAGRARRAERWVGAAPGTGAAPLDQLDGLPRVPQHLDALGSNQGLPFSTRVRHCLASPAAGSATGSRLLHRRHERSVTNLDPALTRPGRMGRRHLPDDEKRKPSSPSYLDKVAHNPNKLGYTPRRDRTNHGATRR